MTVPILERAPLPLRVGRDHADVTVISLRGELDVLDAAALQACLRDIRWHGQRRSIVDLTGLAFIDCTCLSVLVGHARGMRARGGTLALAGPGGTVLRILSVTGLLTWFEVYDTAGQAGAGGHRSLTFPATPDRPSNC